MLLMNPVGNAAIISCPAAIMKRKKSHDQAIRQELIPELRERFETKTPNALAFTMPDKFLCAEMLRADLAVARAAWIADAKSDEERIARHKSDFLADVDQQGRRADFYCLRHTHGARLGDAHLPQKDIQASLHHTKSATTDRYMHRNIDAKRRAVNSLPNMMPRKIPLAATGTDSAVGLPNVLSGACSAQDSTGDNRGQIDAVSAEENPVSALKTGVHQRARRGSNPQPPDRQSGTLTN